MKSKLLLTFLLLFYFSFTGFSQTYPLSSNAKVSILTCGSGQELHSIFGHTAIRIQDNSAAIDVVYNFGMFDFDTPNFYSKFVKGDLEYYVGKSSFDGFLYSYRMENRSVYEQELNLSTTQKQLLYDRLNLALISEDRFYIYKFIDKNCTTMVKDQLNLLIQSPFIEKVDDKTISYRHVLNPFMDELFYQKLGINIMFGYRTDQDAKQLFLPVELLNSLGKHQTDNKPFVNETKTLFEQNPSLLTKSWWNTIYTFLAFLLLILVINRKWLTISFLTLMGFLGIFLLLVGFYSLHREISQNYNVLLFNPLLLGIVVFYLKKNKLWFNRFLYLVLICFAVYLVFLLNKAHLFLMLPILITEVILLFRLKKWMSK